MIFLINRDLFLILYYLIFTLEYYISAWLDSSIYQVQNNWRNRLQETYSEAYCHQVKTCILIALLCVEEDRQKRPNIGEITKKLNEIETAIGEVINII